MRVTLLTLIVVHCVGLFLPECWQIVILAVRLINYRSILDR